MHISVQKEAPFELMFGRKPNLPIDSEFESPGEAFLYIRRYNKISGRLKGQNTEKTQNIVKSYTEKARVKQKRTI